LLLLAALSAAALETELRAADSATAVLQRWCDAQSAGVRIVAQRDLAADKPATPDVRRWLGARKGEPVRYRRVKLACGTEVLSEADNWYLPSVLTPAMNRALEEGDTPFGVVARPLKFHRRTLGTERPRGKALRLRAVLVTPEGHPFSLVVEDYSPTLVRRP
jgi:hypothetical protein